MRGADSRHLTPDEVVERVFPSDDSPVAVPAHLASCAECQDRVARLRSAWLLDRGAVAGVVEALPESFWEGEVESVMQNITMDEPAVTPVSSGIRPFPQRTQRFFMARRPMVVVGSLAALLVLVAGIVATRRQAPAPIAARQVPTVSSSTSSDKADEELLLSIDRVLSEDPPAASFIPEEAL